MTVAGATVAPEALPGDEQGRLSGSAPPLAHEALDPQDTSRTDP